MTQEREKLGSRLGFLLISAGCALGLGNVWRFPYIVGEYGGAAFVVLYLLFLVSLGIPVMVMEFSVGRASQRSVALAFNKLVPEGTWNWFSYAAYLGNFLLMIFYTTVAGWMIAYVFKSATGAFAGQGTEGIAMVFDAMISSPFEIIFWMLLAAIIGFAICSLGLQAGVERFTKWMMAALFLIMILLVARSVTLPGAKEGLEFYLLPDFSKLFANGIGGFSEAVYAAMGQSFFTLSLGIGSMHIFGSYIDKDRSLTGEAFSIAGLDTLAAILAGLIIFPACFAFAINPGEGPSLVFVTLPAVFNQMPLGSLWGSLFFIFMSFAALTTLVAVYENLIAIAMDKWDLKRSTATWRTALAVIVFSLPCALGFNVLSFIELPGIGNIQSIEDFLVSNVFLPLGSMIYVLFCTTRYGWGWNNFITEADTGIGLKFPKWARLWVSYGIPALIIVIFVAGMLPKFAVWFG